jgi:hypothetical protein
MLKQPKHPWLLKHPAVRYYPVGLNSASISIFFKIILVKNNSPTFQKPTGIAASIHFAVI